MLPNGWIISSLCSGGDCISVKSEHGVVYVRDSKQTRDDGQHWGPVQVWELDEWRKLIGCIKVGWNPPGVCFADDAVVVGLERHEHMLVFNEAEWDAFVDGVNNEEFETAALSSKYRAATGAVVTPREAVPVAAEPACGCSDLVADAACGEHGVKSFLRALLAADRLDDELDLLYSPACREHHDPRSDGQPGPDSSYTAVMEEERPVTDDRSEAGTGTSPGPVPVAEPPALSLVLFEREVDMEVWFRDDAMAAEAYGVDDEHWFKAGDCETDPMCWEDLLAANKDVSPSLLVRAPLVPTDGAS